MRNDKNQIIIATRQSQLAIRQAEMVRDALLAADPQLAPEQVRLLPMSTAGDRDQTSTPAQWGLKGLFTKEIEDALLDGRADLAVHSMKDMPSRLPDGLEIAALLPREDPRDALLSPHFLTLDALPEGARVGCSSVRRTALLKQKRPDLHVVAFRGNVNTRLAKLASGEVDATMLAVAGLKRLGLAHHITQILEPEMMLPAVAQGVIGIECRREDAAMFERLEKIHDLPTHYAISAERAMMNILDGSCQTPLCGYATIRDHRLHLRGMVIHPTEYTSWSQEIYGDLRDGEKMGASLANQLLEQSGWRQWSR